MIDCLHSLLVPKGHVIQADFGIFRDVKLLPLRQRLFVQDVVDGNKGCVCKHKIGRGMHATKGIKTAKNEKVMMVFSVPPPKLYNKMPPGIRNRKTALTMVVYRLNEFSIEKEYFVMKSA